MHRTADGHGRKGRGGMGGAAGEVERGRCGLGERERGRACSSRAGAARRRQRRGPHGGNSVVTSPLKLKHTSPVCCVKVTGQNVIFHLPLSATQTVRLRCNRSQNFTGVRTSHPCEQQSDTSLSRFAPDGGRSRAEGTGRDGGCSGRGGEREMRTRREGAG